MMPPIVGEEANEEGRGRRWKKRRELHHKGSNPKRDNFTMNGLLIVVPGDR